ncbi:hypothetical protein [Phytohabitans houttuyneae]|uniref:LigA protein n=1 Tax=Phytohabitans houttuyneae TaxID=1076126 RepID=A0A6V8JYE1_9ACTN|nr:hypothetical protein [Phytohabitans houttuyneae]GFJ76274.1 hypothetical protein Phou_004540 [Phytohabitans houttuyneae]
MTAPAPPPAPTATAPAPSAPAGTPPAGAAASPPGGGSGPADTKPAGARPAAAAPGEAVDGVDGGSWAEPGQATSRPGEGTARNEHWRAARTVHGDQIGGDKVAGHKFELRFGDRTVPVRELSIDLVEPVRYAFVDPDNWSQLLQRFRRQRSAVIRGRPGHGKDAAAIRLLIGEVERVYHLDPTVDVAHLADSIAEQAESVGGARGGIGFLLCQPDGATKLRGFTFHALEMALAKANARLVITISPGQLAADQDVEPYVLDLPDQQVDRQKVFAGHLAWRCGDGLADRLLASETVKSLLGELDEGEASCHSAAELAAVISSECDDSGTVDGFRVRERRRRQHDQAFDLWFDSLRDAEERSFAVALAVLDGLPYEDVTAASRRLRRKLEVTQHLVVSGGKPELRIARNEALRTPTNRLLERLRAVEVEQQVRYAYGMVPVRTVRYKDPSYPIKVIERVWCRYQIQPTLLEWLGELIVERSEPVRIFAASTLGVLSRYSFDYLWTYALNGWANSKDYRLREAVAYALREPSGDKQLAASVGTIVGVWYANREQPRAQATAARAYGAGAGGLDTATAVDRLGRLATVDDYAVAVAIGDALADLIVEDPDRVAPIACAGLLSWFTDRLRSRPAQLAFLILADSLVTWEPDGGGGETRWPTLLHLARTAEALRAPLFGLWRRALSENVLHDQARGVLTGWAGLAEADPAQLDVLLRLFRAVVTVPRVEPRLLRILSALAAEWVRPDNLTPLPRAHRAVDALLTQIRHDAGHNGE